MSDPTQQPQQPQPASPSAAADASFDSILAQLQQDAQATVQTLEADIVQIKSADGVFEQGLHSGTNLQNLQIVVRRHLDKQIMRVMQTIANPATSDAPPQLVIDIDSPV